MLKMLFETGHPWITFKDPCNVRSPQDHVGVIHCSNLCTEITLNTSNDETAVCNLGSVVLETHLRPTARSITTSCARRSASRSARSTTSSTSTSTRRAGRDGQQPPPPDRPRRHGPAVRALPPRRIAFASRRRRRVQRRDHGGDRLLRLRGVSRTSPPSAAPTPATRARSGTAACCRRTRSTCSSRSAACRSKSPRGGTMDWTPLRAKIAEQGMRNSQRASPSRRPRRSRTSWAASPCIEPIYKNLFVKSNLSGDFIVLNPFLVKDLKARGLWDHGHDRQPEVLRRRAAGHRPRSPPT